MPHTGSGLPWHRGQSGIGRQSVHGVTTRQVERSHQRPRRRDPADALDTLEARRGSGPRGIVAESRRDFTVELRELRREGCQQILHTGAHLRDDLGVLHQGMELVAHLLAQIEQVVTLCESLLQGMVVYLQRAGKYQRPAW